MSSEKRRAKWRGKKGELSLVKLFEDYGYKARRSVLSGIGRSLPDVEATKGDTHIVVECKVARTPFVKIRLKQIGKLKDSLDFYDYYPNKIALVAAKFHYGGHYYPYEFFRIPDDRLDEIHKVYCNLMAKLKDINDKRERSKIKSELNRTVLVIRAGEKGDWRPL
jgi:Holliday junction resolvase